MLEHLLIRLNGFMPGSFRYPKRWRRTYRVLGSELKVMKFFIFIVVQVLILPFKILRWLLKSILAGSKAELTDFLAIQPIITNLPNDIEIKKMVRTKSGWRVHYGKKGQNGSIGSVLLTPATTGFSVGGGMARVNGK